MNRRSVSIATAVALVIAIIWGAAYLLIVDQRRDQATNEARKAERLAVFFEQHAEQLIRYSDNYVRAVRRVYAEGSITAVRNFITAIPPDTKIVTHITIIDENGIPRLVSGHKIKPGTHARDRGYFKYQKNQIGDDIFISLPLRGRNSGILTLRVVRRIIKPDGKFGGVVFAALKIGPITEFFNAMKLGPQSSATLVGADKRIRARSTYGRLGPGQDISGSRIWRELAQSPVGLYEQTSVVDGITRYYAYRKLSAYPLIVAIGVSLADISRAITLFEYSVYSIAALTTLVVVVLLLLIYRETTTRHGLEADIEARKQAEMALRESESRYRQLAEVSPDGIMVHFDGTIVFANKGLAQILGAETPEELVGRKSIDLIAPEFREGVELRRKEIRAGKVLPLSEARFIRLDGSEIIVERAGTPISWHGKPSTMILLRDVGERKASEEALRKSEAQLRLVTDAMPAYVSYVDCNQIFRFVNKPYAERLGATADAIVGKHVREVGGYEHSDASLPLIEETLAGNVTVEEGERRWFPDHEPRHHRITRVPHFEDDGKVQGYFTLALDVTEHFQREEQLRHAQKMEAVGQLTGGVAHDFNNLLTVVIGNLELLCSRLEEGEFRNLAQSSMNSAFRGAELTQRLLAFSRKQPLSPKVIDLNECVNNMTDLMHRTLGTDIEIEVTTCDDLWSCEVDPGQIENAVLNLAINARDAMLGGGNLTIGTANITLYQTDIGPEEGVKPGDYVMISVTDSGLGMTRDVLDRAIEPFFTTKEAGEGSGLGLSMVYGFISQSGGRIDIESQVNAGTTVRLYLPRSTSTAEEAGKIDIDHEPGVIGVKVLVVEDDPDVRSLAVHMLHQLGYETAEAGSGKEAIEIVQAASDFDLLLTDVVLVGAMNGVTVAREVAKYIPEIGTVFMSGYSDKFLSDLDEGDTDLHFIAKPFRRAHLADTLRAALGSVTS